MRHDALVTCRLAALGIVTVALSLAGCLDVEQPDLFLVTRAGAPGNLTVLVNSGGTIRCDGGPAKRLPDPMLLDARDLATELSNDVHKRFQAAPGGHSVASYTVKVQNGTFSFPDTAARAHSELSQLELFIVQAAQGPCSPSG